jgi:hypothetical protein
LPAPGAFHTFALWFQATSLGTEVHCHVAYAVVGGTNEQWVLALEETTGQVTCTFFR